MELTETLISSHCDYLEKNQITKRRLSPQKRLQYRLQVEKRQIGNIRIFYFKDKSTRISQPLTCVGLPVSGVSISEEAGWYRQQKKFQTFLSEIVEHDGINSTSARI